MVFIRVYEVWIHNDLFLSWQQMLTTGKALCSVQLRPWRPSQVVSWIKRIMNCEKTGHSGTLDPKASEIRDVLEKWHGSHLDHLLKLGHVVVCRGTSVAPLVVPEVINAERLTQTLPRSTLSRGIWLLISVPEPGYAPGKGPTIGWKRVRHTENCGVDAGTPVEDRTT